MSKLLTDLMEAERKRRRLANSPGAGDAHSGASGQDAAGPAAATLARTAADEAIAAEAMRRAEVESRIEAERNATETAARQARQASKLAAAETQAVAATASHQDMASALAASRSATPRPAAAENPAPAKPGPQSAWWRLFAATALALTAGIGTGIWLGKPPAAPVRPWSDDQGALRLRLDDRLMNPPRQEPRPMPRDRSQ